MSSALRISWALVLLVVALLALALPARAEMRWGVTPSAGQTLLDAGLDDFRWDTTPQAHWGGEAWLRRGDLLGALELRQGRTRQATGLPDDDRLLDVELRSLGLSLRWIPLQWKSLEPFVGLQASHLHLSWEPRTLDVIPTDGGSAVTVDFAPINRWQWGAHVGSQLRVHPRVALRLQVAHDRFSLPTAHRRGGEIVEEDRGFGSWSWSLGVALSPSL